MPCNISMNTIILSGPEDSWKLSMTQEQERRLRWEWRQLRLCFPIFLKMCYYFYMILLRSLCPFQLSRFKLFSTVTVFHFLFLWHREQRGAPFQLILGDAVLTTLTLNAAHWTTSTTFSSEHWPSHQLLKYVTHGSVLFQKEGFWPSRVLVSDSLLFFMLNNHFNGAYRPPI